MMTDYFLYVFNQKNTGSKPTILGLDQLAEYIVDGGDKPADISIYTVSSMDPSGLKAALYQSSISEGFDYCLLVKSQMYGPFKLAVFDMDSTLIPIEVIDELAVQAGVGEEVASITESAMRGELDFNQSLEQRVKQLKGLSRQAIGSVISQLEFNPGVESFCQYFVEQGGDIAIASGGFMPFAEELARRLPFIQVKANRLVYGNKALTGEVEYPIVNAEVKANSLTEWALDRGLSAQQCLAVGDGANDLKMLQQAGIGIAFRAKPTLARSADCVLNLGYLDSLVKLLPIIEQQHQT